MLGIKAIFQTLSGALQAFNAWMRGEEIGEAKKDGARQADLAGRNKQDDVKKAARKVHRKPATRNKRDALSRLRRGNKGKG